MGRSGCLYTQPMARSQGGTGKSSYNSRPSFWAVGTLGCGESGVRLPGGERESSSERIQPVLLSTLSMEDTTVQRERAASGSIYSLTRCTSLVSFTFNRFVEYCS